MDQSDPFLEHFMPEPATVIKPDRLIIPTDDLIANFLQKIDGSIPSKDLDEILTQIVCVLLNAEGTVEAQLRALPDFNRIVTTQALAGLQNAVGELAVAMRDRLMEFGADCDAGFPYFFDGLLYRDVMLTHLPY